MSIRSNHDIIGFQITENNRWLTSVQIVAYSTKLYAYLTYLLDRQLPSSFVELLLKCLTLNEIHHQVPSSTIRKMIINTRKILMAKICEQKCLTFKSPCCFIYLLL